MINVSDVSRAAAIVNMDETTKYSIANCMGTAIAEIEEIGYSPTVENNKRTFAVINNEEIHSLLKLDCKKGYIAKAIERNPELAGLINGNSEKRAEIIEIISECYETDICTAQAPSVEEIIKAVSLYGTRVVADPEELQDGDVLIDADGDGINDRISEAFDKLDDSIEEIQDNSDKKENNEDEEFDPLDIDAKSYTKRVIDSYDILYSVGYELEKPYGVLVKEGALTLRRGKPVLVNANNLAKMYNFISMILKKKGVQLVQSTIDGTFNMANMINPDFRVGTNYYPEMQFLIAEGLLGGKIYSTWDEARGVVYNSIKKNVRGCMTREDVDIETFINAMLTSIVITSFDPEVGIRLRIAVGNFSINASELAKAFGEAKAGLFSGTGEIIRCEDEQLGIIELDIAFDKEVYLNRPMMAYQAVQSMISNNKPLGIRHMIMGEKTNGKMLTYNLDTTQASIMLITAGQRSGKGVLTLNILGTVIADACPFIYADCKPDMSGTIREIAEKNGIKAASWDANENFGIQAINAPNVITSGQLAMAPGVIMYMKLVQLMVVTSKLRRKGTMISDKRPFFIFDEILALQKSIQNVTSVADQIAKNKNKTSSPEDSGWCQSFLSWLKYVSNDLQSAILSEIPSAKMSTIWLNQQIQINAWKSASGADGINPFEKVVNGTLMTKLLGRETFGSEAGLGNLKQESDIKAFIDAKNFALSKSQKIGGREDIEVFKPYLVLNYSENGSTTAEQFKDNVSPEVWRKLAPDGELHPGAGFQGFINMIGENGVSNMGLGYQFLADLMTATGLASKYSKIEDYLYDCDSSSFYNATQLANGIVASGEFGGGDRPTSDDPSVPNLGMEFDEEPKKQEPIFTKRTDVEDFDEPIFGMDDPEPINLATPEGMAAFAKANGGGVVSREQSSNIEAVRDINKQGLEFVNAMRQAENSQINKVTSGSQAFDFDDEFEVGADGQQNKQAEEGINWQQAQSNGAEVEPRPGFTPNNNHLITTKTGKYGTILQLSPDNGAPVIQLDMENSLVAHMPEYSTAQRFGNFFHKTVQGARYNFNERWKAMLSPAKRMFGSDAMVTKAKILERELYLNDRLVIPIGIIGGMANLDIVDICNYDYTFKKFKNLRELIIDKEMFQVLQSQIPNVYEQSFRRAKKLQVIEVIASMPNGDSIVTTRNGFFNIKREQDRAMQMQIEAQKLNQYEAMTATKNPNIAKKSIGYRKRVWDSCSSFAGKSIGGAREQLSRNDKSGGFRTRTVGLVLMSAGAIVLGTAGFVFGGVIDLVKHFRDR